MEFIEKLECVKEEIKEIRKFDEEKYTKIVNEIDEHLKHISSFSNQQNAACFEGHELSAIEKLDTKILLKIFKYCDEGEDIPFVKLLPLRLTSKKLREVVDCYIKTNREHLFISSNDSFLPTIFFIHYFSDITDFCIVASFATLKVHLALCKGNLKKVETFTLENMYIANEDIQSIAEIFPSIKTLHLDIKKSKGEQIARLVNNLPNIRAFHYVGSIEGNCLSLFKPNLDTFFMTHIGECINKDDFLIFFKEKGQYLEKFFIYSDYDESYSFLIENTNKYLTNLKSLSLFIPGAKIENFSFVELTKLTDFQITCDSINFSKVPNDRMHNVKSIELNVNHLNDLMFSRLLCYFPAMETLNLYPNKGVEIGDQTLEAISKLSIKNLTLEVFEAASTNEQKCSNDTEQHATNNKFIRLFESLRDCNNFQFFGDVFNLEEMKQVMMYFREKAEGQFDGSIRAEFRFCDEVTNFAKTFVESNRIKIQNNENSGSLKMFINGI